MENAGSDYLHTEQWVIHETLHHADDPVHVPNRPTRGLQQRQHNKGFSSAPTSLKLQMVASDLTAPVFLTAPLETLVVCSLSSKAEESRFLSGRPVPGLEHF